jgi:hypothetical protein
LITTNYFLAELQHSADGQSNCLCFCRCAHTGSANSVRCARILSTQVGIQPCANEWVPAFAEYALRIEQTYSGGNDGQEVTHGFPPSPSTPFVLNKHTQGGTTDGEALLRLQCDPQLLEAVLQPHEVNVAAQRCLAQFAKVHVVQQASHAVLTEFA